MIASYGEIRFNMTGFILQCSGIAFEAFRLALMQYLLSSGECRMDPLVSLYYFAPVCTAMNTVFTLMLEIPRLHVVDITNVGGFMLSANALLAVALNVSQVFLVSANQSTISTLSVTRMLLLLFPSS